MATVPQAPAGTAAWVVAASPAGLRASEAAPLASAGGRSVVFDGLLYNRADLIAQLGLPSDLSDAAVVLGAYLRWGDDLLRRVTGVFTLVVWDGGTLLCARDPIGLNPLFYATRGDEWLFSTSIHALLRRPGVGGALNRLGIAAYLCHRGPRIEETFFASVRRVPPGHAMRIDRGGARVARYWDPAPPGERVRWVREDEVDRFEDLLDQAVDRCLRLGPAGIYLSGGLDSVTVGAVATAHSLRDGLPAPWALSLVFPHPDCNEEETQRRVAESLGIRQVLMPFDQAVGPQGLLRAAMEMSGERATPLQSVWNPAYQRLGLEGVRRGCGVIVTGSGGDEWLGVTPLYAADLLRALNVAGLVRLIGRFHRSFRLPLLPIVRNVLWTNAARPLLVEATSGTLDRVAPAAVRARARSRLRRATPDWVAPDPRLRRDLDAWALQHYLEQRRLKLGPDGFYLHEIRRFFDHPFTTMEFEEIFENGRDLGVRILHPFWDADLVDMLYRTPPDLLTRDGRSKGLVRGMLARRFPHLGFERQKKVVSLAFFRSRLLQEGRAAWRHLGGVRALAAIGVVDDAAFASTIEEILAGDRPDQAHRIWEVMNLEAWARSHLEIPGEGGATV